MRDWERSLGDFLKSGRAILKEFVLDAWSLDQRRVRFKSFETTEYLYDAFELDFDFFVEASSFSLLSGIILEFFESMRSLFISP